jgi:hypothetical protein
MSFARAGMLQLERPWLWVEHMRKAGLSATSIGRESGGPSISRGFHIREKPAVV